MPGHARPPDGTRRAAPERPLNARQIAMLRRVAQLAFDWPGGIVSTRLFNMGTLRALERNGMVRWRVLLDRSGQGVQVTTDGFEVLNLFVP